MGREEAKMRRRSWWPLILPAIPLLALIVIPPFALLIHTSPGTLLRYLGTSAVVQAIVLSLWTSAVSLLVTIVFGTPLAYLLGRGKFFGKGVLEVLIDWPIVLPPAVAGIALLMTLGAQGADRRLARSGGDRNTVYADRGDHCPDIRVVSVLYQSGVGGVFVDQPGNSGCRRAGRGVADSAIQERDGPAGVSQPDGGWGADVVARAGRVWSDDHFRGELSGPNADDAAGGLHWF